MRFNIIGSGYIAQELTSFISSCRHSVNLFTHRRPLISCDYINTVPFPKSFKAWKSLLEYECDITIFLHTVPSSVFQSASQSVQSPEISEYLSNTKQYFDSLGNLNLSAGLIYASSCSVPTSLGYAPGQVDPSLFVNGYSLFKYLIELQILGSPISSAAQILRISNPYGCSLIEYLPSSILNNIIKASFSHTVYQSTLPLDATRDFLHISDLIKAIYSSAERWSSGIYSLGYGRSFSLSEIFVHLSSTGLHVPEYRFISSSRPQIISSEVSVSDFKQKFCWEPSVTVEEGIRQTFASLE